ncbi:DUF2860 family protein [Campylobacter hepaticus]|uniref:DUF2860 family protein n=1 Tax=Campylobacter hepaticus TaxID=1813019 RepID=UPI0029A1FCCE|nr:DUF2860 family protein [Campylobacter hepaticus]MDX2331689.1 DUF2860 family protein [Campylobacter hepaticus]MDX2372258.1 DUF2860 family protein [Campylobacter hepaticus]MDX2397623.1 DUF2860 family protein [Campylobacter hepaticus]MDX5509461.1 DUF2860 family protein [Campylobacter hepaticus]
MKKYLFLCFASCILAMAIDFEDGLSGNLSLGVGMRNVKSNLSTLTNEDFLSDYNAKNSSSAFIPFLGVELYYGNFIQKDRIFIKNYNGRDISGVILGYEKAYLENLSTSFALVSSLRTKAYANVYQIGQREKTDLSKYGFKISQTYENDFGILNASYLLSKNKYDKDSIMYSSLKREGYYHEFEINYKFTLLDLGLHYDHNNAKGKAQSYSRYGINLGIYLAFAQDYIFNPYLNLSKYKAQEDDPIFHQKQNGKIRKLNVKFIKNQFLGYDGLYSFVNYGTERKNSDISFYDEKYQFLLTGIGYKF